MNVRIGSVLLVVALVWYVIHKNSTHAISVEEPSFAPTSVPSPQPEPSTPVIDQETIIEEVMARIRDERTLYPETSTTETDVEEEEEPYYEEKKKKKKVTHHTRLQ